MSSPGQSSRTPKPADLFEDLWRQLGECHQNTLQELEAKVSKLKKERCLDAQRLEVFHSRNQQLKEQNKTLQDAISLLEERLRAGECDRCTILRENLKNNQDQNLCLIAKLKNERNSLEDENRKLHAELQKLKMSCSEPRQASSPEPEEGIIPDSPVLPSSLPVANKLRKRKHMDKMKHVRYAEMPLPQSNKSLFNELNKELVDATKNPGRAEVLVPNTCELDTPHVSNDVNLYLDEAIAETCGLELLDKPHMTSAGQKSSSKASWKCDVSLKPCCSSFSSMPIHSPDSTTETSPSLISRVKRLSESGSINKAKRAKGDREPEVQEEDRQGIQQAVGKQWEGRHTQPDLIKRTSTRLGSQSFKKVPLDSQVQSTQNGTSNQRPDVSCASPAFKKPDVKEANKDGFRKKGNPLQDLNASHLQPEGEDAVEFHVTTMTLLSPAVRGEKVEPMWSIDPALALSMYESEWRGDEPKEEQCLGELVDTDCTWVSHSLLQCRGENARDSVSGLGKKANDSLDMMFDTTAYGEYKSYNSSCLGQSQPCGGDDAGDYEEGEEEDDEQDLPENSQNKGHNARCPTFAHVAVVRKKDERRKLKGTTCKECDIYYAHLPEEEKQKKLSACSRHRFLYIPPCTPENFWEVGFPSTQTCIERGYIKEEKNPQARSRRRQPFNALFSPKSKKQES
ncbi:DNA endonuclease RBBP8 isoform X1 [Micropterus dolomieu]|uniref:DNA endonuclease RBBP8 isoform X1 n=1 Tax=Micropterus dolomieu TaxID=147949 RepID=UPI001E8CC454|nr:DNA endonuclease RBBP8 isoform X1 [Micropterus dolomieu]XP_045919945.1 DNA endonuclease RBBP8 isoform X1 [Micropterus dolomieu]XP_045919953.1 DNA endonuclease RBBP8 isoform X1 [Micropterus dolomieu]